ncbi:MAG: hypothetical protein KJ621_20705 [Proteobacteria bacterium]|nr:hypothetical protein [Pseudomonadota bacterium]
MPDFPDLSVPPSVPIKEVSTRDTIRAKSEAGYVLTRPRWTTARKRFEVRYQYLTPADFTSLDNFFQNVAQGGAVAFSWNHPQTGSVHTVRFATDDLEWETPTGVNRRHVGFQLEEV